MVGRIGREGFEVCLLKTRKWWHPVSSRLSFVFMGKELSFGMIDGVGTTPFILELSLFNFPSFI